MLSLDSPQLCDLPAVTALKLPSGASACPEPLSAPAGDGVVAGQPATMLPAGGDGFEAALRRISLPGVVGAPAGDGVVAGQPATMRPQPAVTATKLAVPMPGVGSSVSGSSEGSSVSGSSVSEGLSVSGWHRGVSGSTVTSGLCW